MELLAEAPLSHAAEAVMSAYWRGGELYRKSMSCPHTTSHRLFFLRFILDVVMLVLLSSHS
jgi:hypothetical protein